MFQITILLFHLKTLVTKEQIKNKANWREKIIKIREELNKIRNGKTIER